MALRRAGLALLVALAGCQDLTQAGSSGDSETTSGSTDDGGAELPTSDAPLTDDGSGSEGADTTLGLDDTTTGGEATSSDASTDTGTDSGSDSSTGAGPPCGDGIADVGEVCDDGNTDDGDGCSADCSAANCLVPISHATIQLGADDLACPTVWVMPGVYNENVAIDRDVAFQAVLGGPAVIDASGAGRPVTITGVVEVQFDGFEMTGGVQGPGAGIFVDGGTLTLLNTAVTGNVATGQDNQGGGIAVFDGALDVGVGCSVTFNARTHADLNNAQALGGGIFGLNSEVVVGGGAQVTNNVVTADLSSGDANDGETDARGGGICVAGGSLVLDDAVVAQNEVNAMTSLFGAVIGTADAILAGGGGVAALVAPVQIVGGTSIETNTVTIDAIFGIAYGGGVALEQSALDMVESVIEGNATIGNEVLFVPPGLYAGSSGLYAAGDQPALILDSAISGNTALLPGLSTEGFGGGIALTGSVSMRLERSLVDGNQAPAGGGGILVLGTTTLAVVNSTIAGNTTTGNGGAIYALPPMNQPLNLELSNATITDNAAAQGGGLALFGVEVSAVIRNTILFGNSSVVGPDCATQSGPTVVSGGYNMFGDVLVCTGLVTQGTDTTGIDPMMDPLANNGGPTPTHALDALSPAIDAGNPANCVDSTGATIDVDQRGEARYGTANECDVGAYEVVP